MHVTNTVNGVDLDGLAATIGAVNADTALARFQFRARNHWIDGGHNRTTIKDFYGAGQEDASRTEPFVVDCDEPPVLLGHDQAPNSPARLRRNPSPSTNQWMSRNCAPSAKRTPISFVRWTIKLAITP